MPLVHVIADEDDQDAGFVDERLRMHDYRLVLLDRDHLPASVPDDSDLVLLLGSARSAWDAAQSAAVERESAVVVGALDAGVPVLGICYGAQLLAHALGGQVGAAAVPEIGWFEVESADATLCPPGPWAQFHSDAFVAPPGSRELGRSSSGCQGFAADSPSGSRRARALAWQFHPEVTAERFVAWVDELEDYCRHHGFDPDDLRRRAHDDETRLREAAHRLVDDALAWVGAPVIARQEAP